ncbi:MAG: cupin domain-containing protein [Acidobacteria bacterium]|nr:cupin domain-containing protein [Acidobacteriota bacterium]
MRKTLCLAVLVAVAVLGASAIPGFLHWPAVELQGWNAKLTAQMKDSTPKGQDLGKFGNHGFGITRRVADGEAEVHERVTDLFLTEAGEAELLVGGKVLNPRTAGPGEGRGSGIEGGRRVTLRPGDLVRIPADMPHQLLVKKEFLYFVVKIQQAGPETAEGFTHWAAADRASARSRLASQLAGKTVAVEAKAFGNHSKMMVYRTGDGEVEVHEKQADIFIVESGEGVLVVGGKTVGAHSTAPGEIRGASMDGGERVELHPGDVARIPAGVPHQALTRKELMYTVVKVTQ